jgi:predicted cupin superfamily sugar epimerase
MKQPSSHAAPLNGRAAELVDTLGLQPHPEGGWYAEVFRSAQPVGTADGRAPRVALTTIDFLLTRGQCSAWHRVLSDEVWHLLEGEGLRLWLARPDLSAFSHVDLGPVQAGRRPRAVVPAGWWQAAEPLGEHAYVGATVGPGFEFADFSFGRDDPALRQALAQQAADLQRLL